MTTGHRNQRAMPPLQLDFDSPTWTADERAQMMRWYEVFHGTGDSRLVKFAPFQIDHNPAGFKRYRQHATKLASSFKAMSEAEAKLYAPYRGLLTIHLYAAIGNGEGCLYEVVGFRMHGITRRQVKETLAFAFLNGGPFHTNAVAEALGIYLDAWQEDQESPPEPPPFPPGWAVDPALFRSGIEAADAGLTADDVTSIENWHDRMGGGIPPHVRLWAELHPEAFKTQRLRFEASIGKTIPAQMYPLMQLQHAAYMGWPSVARRAILWARRLGVRREYAVSAMELAFIYGGESKMELVLTPDVADVLRNWPAQKL